MNFDVKNLLNFCKFRSSCSLLLPLSFSLFSRDSGHVMGGLTKGVNGYGYKSVTK